ncbi:MAG TPA: 3'-5' exonuclease, partial [Candidatus Omnitrophota bacterium]|nr:3'-5' exonuclease [Candidatus Omnitrophota bacterium]
RQVTIVALGLGAIVLALAVLAALPAVEGGGPAPLWLAGALLAAGWLGLMVAHEMMRRHFDDLKVLQAGLEALSQGQLPPQQLTTRFKGKGGHVVERLALLISDISTRRAIEGAKPDQRMASVIAALKDGVVVVTDTGLVSLINAGAKAVLGAERAGVGTSIYAALDRDGLVAALDEAKAAGRKAVTVRLKTVDGFELPARIADFGEHKGAVITFEAAEAEHIHDVEVALDLHDRPPVAVAPVAATLLDELPVTVLDTETTGLDVKLDRIVSIGAVRMHGQRLFRSTVIDRLVNPGKAIPQRATAVHGITTAMVAGQPPAAEILPEVLAMLQDTVVVGHNIGFDLALLKRAAAEAGLDWPAPPWLDLILLAGALDPEEGDLNLDTMAERAGVNISGRHTALGDALVTAELWGRMQPVLARQGVRTLGEAIALSRQAKHIIAQQRASGW